METLNRKKISPKDLFEDVLEQIKVEWLSGRSVPDILEEDYGMESDDDFCDLSEALTYLEAEVKKEAIESRDLNDEYDEDPNMF